MAAPHLLSVSLLPCMWRQWLGISCPICGLQRSLLLLFHGRVGYALLQWPPMAVVIPIAVWLLALVVAHKTHRATQVRWPWVVLLATLVANMAYQNIINPSF
ncbi:MAG: DUF2752 domain-containing protein [Bacteroidales bacterium]|nr:DUF2752 domain-containing protein [Bacteroidales bacterium]